MAVLLASLLACMVANSSALDLADVVSDLEHWPKTDFSRHTVALDQILDSGPGKDGFQSLDAPRFESASKIDWLDGDEPVAMLKVNHQARAYPLQILMYHEIVNDELEGIHFALTYCPLCNAAIFLRRTVDGKNLDFGTAGKVIDSNMIMYDRQTESWWQQFTGEGVVGQYAGHQLQILPSQIVSFAQFRQRFPNGEVLSRDTGFTKRYGINPYVGYDSRRLPWRSFYKKPVDTRLPAMQRVLGIVTDGATVAIPFSRFADSRVMQFTVNGADAVLFGQEGPVSPVDQQIIKQSRKTYAAAVFSRQLENGQILDFDWRQNGWVDRQTGSIWNLFGEAVQGPLLGEQLRQIDYGVYFAFVWFNFFPESELYE